MIGKMKLARSYMMNPEFIRKDTVLIPFEGLSKENQIQASVSALQDASGEMQEAVISQRKGFALGTDLQEWLKKSFPEVQFDFVTKNRLGKTYEYGLPYPKSEDSREARNLYQKIQNAVKYKKLDPTFEVGEYQSGVRKPSVSRGQSLKEYGGLTPTQMDNARYENATFEIDRNNKLGIATDVKELANKTGIQKSALHKFIKEGKIIAPADRKDLVIQYIKNAYDNNEPLENFKQENIRKYINHGVSAESGSKLGEKTLSDFVRIDVKRELPEIYKLIYSPKGGAIRRIPNVKKLKDLPVLDYEADPNAATREQMASTQKKGVLRSKINILEGKLKLGKRDYEISEAMDQYVRNLNAQIKEKPSIVLDNPKLMELATTTFDNNPKSATYGQLLPNTRSVDKVMGDIDKGFFSTEHLVPKATKQGNIEFPTNKVIVPRTTNGRLIRQAQSFFENNPGEVTSLNEFESFVKNMGFNVRINNKTIGPKIGSTVEGGKLRSYPNSVSNYGIDPNIVDNTITSLSPVKFSNVKAGIKQNLDILKRTLDPKEIQLANQLQNQLSMGVNPETLRQLYGKELDAIGAKLRPLGNMGKEAMKWVFGGTVGEVIFGAALEGTPGLETAQMGGDFFSEETLAKTFVPYYGAKVVEPVWNATLAKMGLPKMDIKSLDELNEMEFAIALRDSGISEDEQADVMHVYRSLKRQPEYESAFQKKLELDELEKLPQYQYGDNKKRLDLERKQNTEDLTNYEQMYKSHEITNPQNLIDNFATAINRAAGNRQYSKFKKAEAEKNDVFKLRSMGATNLMEMNQTAVDPGFLPEKVSGYTPLSDFEKMQNFVTDSILPEDASTSKATDIIRREVGVTADRPTPLPNEEVMISPDDILLGIEQSFAEGGRVGFKKGGFTRRGFLGLMSGLGAYFASLPFFKPATKVGAKVLEKAPSVKGMPEWFAPLADEIYKKGKDITEKAATEDGMIVKQIKIDGDEVNGVFYRDGKIEVDVNSADGAFDSSYSLLYDPPTAEYDEVEGLIEVPGNFRIGESTPRSYVSGDPENPDWDWDLDYEDVDFGQHISDTTKLEKHVTGKPERLIRYQNNQPVGSNNPDPVETLIEKYGEYDGPYED